MSQGFQVLEGRLEPLDREYPGGLLHGYAVFEAVRVYDGHPFHLGAHLNRMRAGAERLRLELPGPDIEVEQVCRQAVEMAGLAEARLRLVWSAQTEGASLWRDVTPLPARLLIFVEPVSAELTSFMENGVDIVVSGHGINERSLVTGVKTIGYAAHILAKREALEAGAYEGLILDCEGRVVEGSMSNIFIVKAGVLVTPPLEAGPLPGVTRQAVLDLAPGLGVEVRQESFDREAIVFAEECFLTASTAEIVPVLKIDGSAVGNGKPGPTTRRLQEAYSKLIRMDS